MLTCAINKTVLGLLFTSTQILQGCAEKNMYTKWQGALIKPTSFKVFIRYRMAGILVYFYLKQNLNEPQGPETTSSPGCLSSGYNQEESNIHFFWSIFKGLTNKLNNKYAGNWSKPMEDHHLVLQPNKHTPIIRLEVMYQNFEGDIAMMI